MERDDFFSEVTSIQYLTGHREKFSNFIIVFPTRILKKVKILTFFSTFFFGCDFFILKNKIKNSLCLHRYLDGLFKYSIRFQIDWTILELCWRATVKTTFRDIKRWTFDNIVLLTISGGSWYGAAGLQPPQLFSSQKKERKRCCLAKAYNSFTNTIYYY